MLVRQMKKTGSPPNRCRGGLIVKSRLIGSACLLALVTVLASTSVGEPLEDQLLAIASDIRSVPVAVWVAAVGLIGLDVIARRSSAGK
jgi:hypothetical protein